MPFGVVGRMGPGMWLVVGFGERPAGRGNFYGENMGCSIVTIVRIRLRNDILAMRCSA